MRDVTPHTPVQQRTLDELMGRQVPRPVFAEDLADRLRDHIAQGIGALSFEQPLWVSKHRLTDHGRCEGLFVANLLGEGDGFQHRMSSAAGALAHKGVEIDVGRERQDASAELVDRAAERLVETDGTFAAYWDGIDAVERSEVSAEAVRMVEQFRATFPPLEKAWTPVTEWPVRVEFGDVVLSGRVDLMLGRENPDVPMQARRLAMDLKSGRAWPEFPEDMRLYALILTLRLGVPPFRVATVFLESGTWQGEDVDERTLFHAADRVVRAVQTAARLLDGGVPVLTPGGYCSWCPRRVGCPAADAAAEAAAGVAGSTVSGSVD